MIVLLDNYDSFVHNLARYFTRLGQSVRVVRNDALSVSQIAALQPRLIVLSPGPCTPREAGVSLELVRCLLGDVPMFGVCLGHQTIAAALGANIVRAAEPMHGRTSRVHHDGRGVFAAVPNPFMACRYHSLAVDPGALPRELVATAHTDDGTVMALAHRTEPAWGVQFHPEAVLTEHGYQLLANVLRLAGLLTQEGLPTLEDERRVLRPVPPLPAGPVTF